MPGLLDGCKVIDMASLFAGPFAATLLGDHGADVIKIEHPRGDDLRDWGPRRDGHPLWWKVVSRNKRCVAVDLHDPDGQDVIRRLVAEADVLISNFRPGRLDAWGLGWDALHEINPRLVMAEVTGFGQSGPHSSLAGFGTLAEAMSGFAAVTGEAGGAPMLPPFGLADGIAGMCTAFAVSSALHSRTTSGVGVHIDTALYEPLMWIIGSHIVEHDQLGIVQERMGNSVPQVVPRNAYRTSDDRWIALSGAAQAVAERLFRIVGRPEAITDPRFATNAARIENRAEVDEMIGGWVARHTRDDVVRILREADAAVAPIYDATDIVTDPHFRFRESVLSVPDPDLGPLGMQGVVPKVDGRAGSVRWTGSSVIGSDTAAVLSEIGIGADRAQELHARGAVHCGQDD
ncbi:CaiB/BaiF CoA transferase family protein [Pseudonocardia sp. HH130630-07]|uniref:CaiB/BaiF CoA transferase family protein n=1 Tax=Pseudonocardia sp. HH130630-07 TaxID=1690815 RepID=UPI000815196A|nr:CoA transferase [Pseudonocardia sp. HH130630-07]ANY08244.1 acyl-CoA transferase [Pseudonocardia sp. HH130630-07]